MRFILSFLAGTDRLWCAVLATMAVVGCKGGELTFQREDTVSVAEDVIAVPPPPAVIEVPFAPAGYTTTPEQGEEWKDKLATDEPFNDLLVNPEAVAASASVSEEVRIEPDRLCVPIEGNEALLDLVPGTPFVGKPSVASRRNGTNSNNVFGFMRKVKSVSVVDGEIAIETEQARLEDIFVGAASFEFPRSFTPLNVGPDVDLWKIDPTQPPKLDLPASKPGAAGLQSRSGGLEYTEGFSFSNAGEGSIIDAEDTYNATGTSLVLGYLAYAQASAVLEAGAFLKASVEWDPFPNLTYFMAAIGGTISIDYTVDFVTSAVEYSGQPADAAMDSPATQEALRSLALNPKTRDTGDFTLGTPNYYEGPTIWTLPTAFAISIVGRCTFQNGGRIDANAWGTQALDAKFGIQYDSGTWSPIVPQGWVDQSTFTIKKVRGGGGMRCMIGPRLAWLFAGVAGPTVTFKQGLDVKAVYEALCPDLAQIRETIDRGIAVGLGVTFDIWVWSTSWSADLIEDWWTFSANIEPTTVLGTCVSHCDDGSKNDFETGIDCGGDSTGGTCPDCNVGSGCKTEEDCVAGLLCLDQVCQNLNCQTGQTESYMTDVNCGDLCGKLGFTCGVGKGCVANADCTSGTCSSGLCGSLPCNNGLRDGTETGVDCGGGSCPVCATGGSCRNDTDCADGLTCLLFGYDKVLGNHGACLDSSCDWQPYANSPSEKKGDMTDVLCGGNCAKVAKGISKNVCTDIQPYGQRCGDDVFKCPKNKACAVDTDCQSGKCKEGICRELACDNGLKESYETDKDCGGWCQPKGCSVNKHCDVDADCQTGLFCVNATSGGGKVCAPCKLDGVKNGAESDIDCGASCTTNTYTLGGCKLGQGCKSIIGDCATGYSTTLNGQPLFVDIAMCKAGVCQHPCVNGTWDNGYDTDIDCGGVCPKKCVLNQGCGAPKDCTTDNCLGQTCKSSCLNGKKDANEGATDCGTACAPQFCQKGQTCAVNSDCQQPNTCLNGVCGFEPCSDGFFSQGEADKDCGGNCTKKCIVAQSCKAAKDCESGFCNGSSGGWKCVATACEDKVRTTGETDVDCGGICASVKPCADAKKCKVNTDCASGICSAGGLCVTTTCKDQKLSVDETDVDCGGACPTKCTTNGGCNGATDCDSGFCGGGVCVGDHCSDKVFSTGEADVDCGGTCAKKCSTGKACKGSVDCTSGVCSSAGKCVASSCEDGKKSSGEPDVDCGGSCKTPCLNGKGCATGADCASSACAAQKLVCVASACFDETKGGTETDVDCGGGACKKCAAGKGCAAPGDCASAFCDGTACVGSACENNAKDVGETGVDCGGTCTAKCAVGGGCIADQDCQSGACDGTSCVGTACSDKKKSAGETDVDCGGTCAITCALGKGCAVGTDCDAGICSQTSHLCVAGACEDQVKGAGEADVDCGGTCATKCGVGQGCGTAADCGSGFCNGAACVASACQDQEASPGETDIDCGGVCQTKCGLGRACVAGKDCDSGFCDGTQCVASACEDKKLSPGETGIDCGGTCQGVATCALGVGCVVGADCAGGVCASQSHVCVSGACADELKGPGEADVDCGGGCPTKCAAGKACGSGADCQGGFCGGGSCVGSACEDKSLSVGETDVDCGGTCAAKCATGFGCAAPKDCASGFCNGSQCVATACEDAKLSAGETDVDCGGGCTADCTTGKKCVSGADCGSGICAATSLVCVSTACEDEAKGPTESDADCGGTCPVKCTSGQGCGAASDCDSGSCNGTTCVGGPCEDQALSVGETDVDCGGGCTAKCAVGKGCAAGKDCQSGFCNGAQCVATACEDGKLSAGETGVDCGGTCTAGCGVGAGCASASDCTSGLCAAQSHVCVAEACADEVKGGGETGVDCGGSCVVKCPVGDGCAGGADCQSGFCGAGACVASACEDTVLSAGETGIDCGGTCQATCPTGAGCAAAKDCQSGFCDGATCVATACEDKKKSAGETDVDCGGSCQAKCGTGQGCALAADCAGGYCARTSLVCVATACEDEEEGGTETDVDCGGDCQADCAAGKGCDSAVDCESGSCDGTVCVNDPCQDQALSAGEVDVDCGGVCPVACLLGQKCNDVGDCQSGFCDGTHCVGSACEDLELSAGETDVDCGGTCQSVATCTLGEGCAVGSDCASGICAQSSLVCVADGCVDEAKNGQETDIDCGGGCAAKCGAGGGCAGDGDCLSGYCDGSVCVTDSCFDKRMDEDETDVDCGGGCVAQCATGKGCVANGDCVSGWCDGTTCVASACLDKKLDAGESDVDCGGPCTDCALGKDCASGGDCASNVCAAVSLVCVASACQNEVKDSTETGIDCAGGCASLCTVGLGCQGPADCQSGYCDGTVCVASHCEDKVTNVGETALDCGGGCPGCAVGQACLLAADCATNACGAQSSLCVASTCVNQVKDNDESDLDCGGSCSTKCTLNKACAIGADCASGFCGATSHLCVADQCHNQQKDGAEAGVDCGGGSCAGCPDGTACTQDTQCLAGVCLGATGSKTCGCPAGLLALTVNTGAANTTKTVECAWNVQQDTTLVVYPSLADEVTVQGGPGSQVLVDATRKRQWLYNYNPSWATQKKKWGEAQSFCDTLSWANSTDWRLPTLAELMSLYSLKATTPPPAPASYYETFYYSGLSTPVHATWWTANPVAFGSVWGPGRYFALDSSTAALSQVGGKVVGLPVNDIAAVAMCVRSTDKTIPTVLTPRLELTLSGDGAKDNQTGVTWQRAGASNLTKAEAYDYCNNLTLGGFSDWAIPDHVTLMSVVEPARAGPFWDKDIYGLPDPQDAFFAASTYSWPNAIVSDLEPVSDRSNASTKPGFYGVRCVRK